MPEHLKSCILFLALAAVILLRVTVEQNGFTTPDSLHYMAAAKSILQDGDLTYNMGDKPRFFSLWPAGYPFSIAFISGITTLSPLWSSKVVNLLWLALAFVSLHRKYPRHSFWIGLVFCSNSLLEIFSYTWSEAGFIVALLWSSITLHSLIYKDQEESFFSTLNLIAAGLTLFLYRYVGGFITGVIGLFATWMVLLQRFRKAIQLLGAGLAIVVGMGCYFWYIYSQTGHYSGAIRLDPDESLSYLFLNLAQTQANEWFLIRKMSFTHFDFLATFFFLLQISLMVYAFLRMKQVTNWKKELKPNSSDSLPFTIALVGGLYWSVVVGLRVFIMKFDSFDFRIIGPTSALFLIALHAYLAAEQRGNILQKIQRPLTVIYLVSLAHGLYKKQLLVLFLK